MYDGRAAQAGRRYLIVTLIKRDVLLITNYILLMDSYILLYRYEWITIYY